MKPAGEGFVVIDLLGREVSGILDWLEAEELLESRGIGYLADAYELRLDDGEWHRVRLAEVSTREIRAKKDDWGDMTAQQIYYSLPFPAPETLRVIQP